MWQKYKRNAALSYEKYKEKYPQTQMSKSEYEKRYTQQNPHVSPSKSTYPHPYPKKFDEAKSFDKTLQYARGGGIKSHDDLKTILHHLGHKPDKFVDHLFSNLGKTTSFEDIRNFESLGVIPKSYTQRRLKNHDLAGQVPPKYHAEYGIKTSSLKEKFSSLAKRLGVDFGDFDHDQPWRNYLPKHSLTTKKSSLSRHCSFYKAKNGKWYMELASREHGDRYDSDCYGPFDSKEDALDYLDRFSNPGMMDFDSSGTEPVPKKSPNGKPVRNPKNW